MDVVRTQREMARRTHAHPPHADTTTTTPTRESSTTKHHHPYSNLNSTTTTASNHQQYALPHTPRKRFSMLHRRRRRSSSAPPAMTSSKLLEDHYRVEGPVVLPGVPRYEQDLARDTHDCFNLGILLPVIGLDVMNWNWDRLLYSAHGFVNLPQRLQDAWTGEYFYWFFAVTLIYFLIDLIWIAAVPNCVKSPATILQHHVATLVYILIPFYFPEYRWCMGACMSVEVNTWFLIARRQLNKQGFPPWTISLSCVSIRVKLLSIMFYATWIGIRCCLYPMLLGPFYQNWVRHSEQVGTPWNMVMLCLPLHFCFCVLNLKWTHDLLMSKVRYWRRKGPRSEAVSRGL